MKDIIEKMVAKGGEGLSGINEAKYRGNMVLAQLGALPDFAKEARLLAKEGNELATMVKLGAVLNLIGNALVSAGKPEYKKAAKHINMAVEVIIDALDSE